MNKCKHVYAAYAKNEELRLSSSSGAMFSLLAEYIILNGGIVYGVRMTEDCYGAEYDRVINLEGLKYLRGSKYFQARVGDTYKKVKLDLVDGKKVLFTGTGCFVNGLKAFLQREYTNLYCMDIICHGTPSPKLWKKYVEYCEKQYNSKIVYASFRNKDKRDWNGFEMKISYQNNTTMWLSRHTDSYFSMFVKNVCLRPSCFSCTAKFYKMSDITVADFWGIENVAPEMNDNLGISLVLVRNDKGHELFDLVQDKLEKKEVSYEEGVRENKSEYQSYLKPNNRDSFFRDMNKMNYKKLAHKYLDIPIWRKVVSFFKKKINMLFNK